MVYCLMSSEFAGSDLCSFSFKESTEGERRWGEDEEASQERTQQPWTICRAFQAGGWRSHSSPMQAVLPPWPGDGSRAVPFLVNAGLRNDGPIPSRRARTFEPTQTFPTLCSPYLQQGCGHNVFHPSSPLVTGKSCLKPISQGYKELTST